LPRAAGLPERLAIYAAGGTPPPYQGALRWSWAAEHALLGWWYWVYTEMVWCTLRGLPSKKPFWFRTALQMPGACALAVALFAAYPLLAGARMKMLLAAGLAVVVLVQASAAISFVTRWKRPTITESCTLVLAFSVIADGATAVAARHLGLLSLWPVIGW